MQIKCEICDKSFKGQSGLNWHLDRSHSVNSDDTKMDMAEPADSNRTSESDSNPKLKELEAIVLKLDAKVTRLVQDNERMSVSLDEANSEITELKSQIVELQRTLQSFHAAVDELKSEASMASEQKGFLSFPFPFTGSN